MYIQSITSSSKVSEQQYPSLEDLIGIISDTYHQFPIVSDGKAISSIRFDEVRNPVRKVIRRSNYRQSYQLFSRKMDMTMSCESVIEFNGCHIMEIMPEVKSYYMQPAEITYDISGEKHRHIPDALIEISNDRKCFLEFKASRELNDEELQARTDLMRKHLPAHGYGYLVICDEQVTGVPLANAKKLNHIQRTRVSKTALLEIKSALDAKRIVTIEELVAILGTITNIKNILYQLLRQGVLGFNKKEVITDDSEIYWKGVL